MLCKVYCACCNGLEVTTVTVEVSVTDGIRFFLVGLPDNAVKESQQRIESALQCYGFRIPGKRITINLSLYLQNKYLNISPLNRRLHYIWHLKEREGFQISLYQLCTNFVQGLLYLQKISLL